LIHLTDYTQNSHFMDDYMDGIAIDLSRATFIFSFNDKRKISPILLDRMEIIKFNSYSNPEKIIIARDYLLPNVIKNVFSDENIKVEISEANMRKIVCGPQSSQHPPVHLAKRAYKLGQIMKKVAKGYRNGYKNGYMNGNRYMNIHNHNHNNNHNNNHNGGVRYIKKILEKIVSRINLQLLEKDSPKQKKKLIIVNDNIVNEILNDK